MDHQQHPAEIDRDSANPVWFQLKRRLEARIAGGEFAPGAKLPSEHELCAEYGLSRNSVRYALDRLEQDGLIHRRQGAGAFVTTSDGPVAWTLPSSVSLLGEHREGRTSVLTSTVLRAGVEMLPPWAAAGFLGQDNGLGTVVERVRSVGQLTAVHVVNYLPKRFSGVLPGLRNPRASLYAELEQVAGVRITRMHRTIEAVSADRRLGALLGVEEGYPLVVVEAAAYAADGALVDMSRASVRTDRMRVTADSGYEAGPTTNELGVNGEVRA